MAANKKVDIVTIIGIALIAFGVVSLGRMLLGPWLSVIEDVLRQVTTYGWPVLLIVLGILVLQSSRKGGLDFSGKRLYRSRSDKKMGGVIAGFAKFLSIDVTLLRLLFIFALVLGAWWPMLLAYLVAMVVVPEEPTSNTWYS